MKVTATEFRKDLFGILQRVVGGETVEVLYKDSAVRIIPSGSPSKLSRAKRQPTLLCDPDAIVHNDPALMAEMESQWRKDWKKI